jgi:hypothetical protein
MTAMLADGRAELLMSQPPAAKSTESDELRLAALPSAIPCARLLVEVVGPGWRLDRRCLDAASEAVAVLVAHAIATIGVVEPGPTYRAEFDHLTVLTVRLRLIPRLLVVEVWDSGSGSPEPLLSNFAPFIHSWGYDVPSPGQRVVWCTVPAYLPEPDDTVQIARVLPRRKRQAVPAPGEPITVMRDRAVLQRVLDGLRRLNRQEDAEC